jgi:hypothetical protein
VSDVQKHAALAGEAGGGRIIFLNRVPDGFEWACDACSFHRVFATRQGARQKITEHVYICHRIQLIWRGEQ